MASLRLLFKANNYLKVRSAPFKLTSPTPVQGSKGFADRYLGYNCEELVHTDRMKLMKLETYQTCMSIN